ncbi:MAG TPA: RNA polymerase sigma factor [Candidatus Paceibacterota bacterium]|nr:RNA polymerase sigma factor [Candidatus Paceibacterota bacterium]
MVMSRLQELFENSAESDPFEKLYTEFFTPVYRYVFMRLRDKDISMDIVQTVFLKAYQNRNTIRYDEGLRYLYTIARNTLIDHLRKKHSVAMNDLDEFMERIPDSSVIQPEQAAISDDNAQFVQKLLGFLSESQREAITLRYIQELDYDEMALITGKSESTLRQSVSRGLRILQEHYTTHYE